MNAAGSFVRRISGGNCQSCKNVSCMSRRARMALFRESSLCRGNMRIVRKAETAIIGQDRIWMTEQGWDRGSGVQDSRENALVSYPRIVKEVCAWIVMKKPWPCGSANK